MCRYWNIARIQTIKPKVVNNHHNHVLSDPEAKSVECLTIRVHFARERPNPAKAPYLKKERVKSVEYLTIRVHFVRALHFYHTRVILDF